MRITKYALMFLLATGVVACNDETEKPQAITNDEAAEVMAASIAANSYGVVSVFNKSADVTAESTSTVNGRIAETCGVLQNISISGSSPTDAIIKFSYDFSYKFQLDCDEGQNPQMMHVNLSYSGLFDGPHLTSEHTGTGELIVEGLAQDDNDYLANGYFKRSGSVDIKGEEPKSVSGTVEITINAVTIDKETGTLLDGTLAIEIKGTVEGKGDYNYTGLMTFDGTAFGDLKIGRKHFDIDLNTGAVGES